MKETHKDSIFRALFSSNESMTELYNALSGEDHPRDTEVVPVTAAQPMYEHAFCRVSLFFDT